MAFRAHRRRALVSGRATCARRTFPGPGGLGGGPNDGHLGLIFNIAGRGYFISVHFEHLPDRSRIRLASAFAQWLERQIPLPAPRSQGGELKR